VSRRRAYIDFQARASAFEVGSRVFTLLGGNPAQGGTVVAVWPAIGMVDVQFPHGSTRYAVEDLVIDTSENYENFGDFQADSIPGGTPTVSVPGGPGVLKKDFRDDLTEDKLLREASSRRVASPDRVIEALVKKALYWDSPDRKYRMCKSELGSGVPTCPRCVGVELRKVLYKREDGRNEKLYACSDCLFLIRRGDVVGLGV